MPRNEGIAGGVSLSSVELFEGVFKSLPVRLLSKIPAGADGGIESGSGFGVKHVRRGDFGKEAKGIFRHIPFRAHNEANEEPGARARGARIPIAFPPPTALLAAPEPGSRTGAEVKLALLGKAARAAKGVVQMHVIIGEKNGPGLIHKLDADIKGMPFRNKIFRAHRAHRADHSAGADRVGDRFGRD